jgi:hypothetical protein
MRGVVHYGGGTFGDCLNQLCSKPLDKKGRVGVMLESQGFDVGYNAIYILAPCGNNICPFKLFASLCVLNFDTTNSPAIFPDKVLILILD